MADTTRPSWFTRQLAIAVRETQDWPDWAKREAGIVETKTGRTVTLEMPLPPRYCRPNTRSHWRYVRAAVEQHKSEAFYITKQARSEPLRVPVVIGMTFYCGGKRGDGRYRPMDVGNAISSVKALVDGIVAAGLLPDDNHKVLRWGRVDIIPARDSGGRACVVVELREETGDDG